MKVVSKSAQSLGKLALGVFLTGCLIALTGVMTVSVSADFSSLKLPLSAASFLTRTAQVFSAKSSKPAAPPVRVAQQTALEADVSPRASEGNGNVTVTDWIQIGRFAAGLDPVTFGAEFQRADCAPKENLGEGRLNIADWVQAGRYAFGADPLVQAGGPAAPVAGNDPVNDQQQARLVRVLPATFTRGQDGVVAIELLSQGNENAVGFTLNFDPTQLVYSKTAIGGDAVGAIFFVNPEKASTGSVLINLALPSGQKFAAGLRQILLVTFNIPATSTLNSTTVSFTNGQIVDEQAVFQPAGFQPGVITLTPTVVVSPVLIRLSPNTAQVGGADFTLTLTGTGLSNGSVVRVNGSDRPTTFVNGLQLRATVLASDLLETGTLSITVRTLEGAISNALSIVVTNPVPVLTSLNPNASQTNGPAFTLTANGSNFVPGAIIKFGSSNRVTTFVSSTQLTANIPASEVRTAATIPVSVTNPEPGGGFSNTLNFTVSAPKPIPRITALTPNTIQSGSAGFTLQITGSGFTADTVVRWNGAERPSSFVSATQLTAQITAEDVATAGNASVTAFNSPPGGGVSAAQVFTITPAPNPVPVLTAINPPSVASGSGQFTLIVTGTGFVTTSVVRLNGQDRPTTFVTASEIRAAIPAADILNGGTLGIKVFNPAPGGGLSNELTLTTNFSTPTITLVSPTSIVAGGPAFTLTVAGTNFAPGSIVRWDGQNRPTTVVSVTEIQAQIPATDIANVGSAQITVFSPIAGAGSSNAITFQITQAARPIPRLAALNPDKTTMGGPAFTLAVSGGNFVNDSVVRWNGSPRPTTFVNSTQLTAQISEADIASAGTATVTVYTPPAGGGESNGLAFQITQPPNPVPVITTINPPTASTAGAAFTLTVNGANFVQASVVRINNQPRSTTFVSTSQLTAQITAEDIAASGTAQITVLSPAPGGGVSNAVQLNILNPVPSLTNLNPNVVAEGSQNVTLTANGANFIQGSQLLVNGQPRLTAFVSNTQLTTQLTTADTANTGSLTIQVLTPQPGGGTSAPQTLEVRRRAAIPRITALNPEVALAGGNGFTLIITGANFAPGAVVRFNGQDRPTEFSSETLVVAQIPASDILAAGAVQIMVFNPPPGGGSSNIAILTVNNPTPRLTSINPDAATVGAGAFTLTVNGTNFVPGSIVRFNGVDQATTLVSSSQLTAQIPAAALAATGAIPITVFNPAPGGGASNALSFAISNPVPILTSLSPNGAAAGGPGFVLTVTGTNFVNGSVVRWNGAARPTTFVNATQLTAQVTEADIANVGSANVSVFNPGPGGGVTGVLAFAIRNEPNPVPALTSLSPDAAIAGSAALALTVTGTNFVANSRVLWKGAARPTTFISATQLLAQIPAADLASAGAAAVTVFNPAPAGGTSNALNFNVVPPDNPVPTATALNPGAVLVGAAGFTLTVQGTGFVPGAVVRVNGGDRATSFVSATQLTAQLGAADVATAGTLTVTVFNPAPGGGASNGLALAVNNPAPTLTGLDPALVEAGGAGFTLTINGAGFVNGSVVQVNGANRAAAFVSSTALTVPIAEADIAATGVLNITVANPAPGGGVSNPLPLTINNPRPIITSITPDAVAAGSAPFTLTVNGVGFVPGSVVRWNNQARPTTFVSRTQVTAAIAAEDIAVAATVRVTVLNPTPGGGSSLTSIFTVDRHVLCQTICFQAPQYYLLNMGRWPGGSIFIGGVNFNQPVTVNANSADVKRALQGGESPLQLLNKEYVAAQLSTLSAGFYGTAGALNGSLRCYGVAIAAVRLDNDVVLSGSSTLGTLFAQARQAISDRRDDDMLKIAVILKQLNGETPSNRCQGN